MMSKNDLEQIREMVREAIHEALLQLESERPVPVHLNVAQAAQMLDMHRQTLRKQLEQSGSFNGFKRVPYSVLVKLLKERG